MNLHYSCSSQTLAGIGNTTSNPLFVNSAADNYYLLAGSPCIDTGDPGSPLDPDATRADMGALYFDQSGAAPDIIIELTYVSGSPVPASGGNLYFDVFVQNAGTTPVDYDAWLEIAYEGGPPTTVVMRSFANYMPAWTINRPGMFFPISSSYAAGNYTFGGKVGINPNTVWDESGFPFVKSGTDTRSEFIPWVPDGVPNPFDEIITDKEVDGLLPMEFALNTAYPNPFNPATTLGFALPEASRVKLTVYDISGRLVAEVVDGWHDAGYHEVSFNATHLASGVYIYRMVAGDFTATGKMVLMK